LNRPPAGPRPAPWRQPSWRVFAFCSIVFLAFVALLVRLIQVQLVDGARYRAQAQANQIRLIPVAP
jgi:cell division protein FtsI/penicillin-binding protein 2